MSVEQELADHATYVALERVFGRWIEDKIRRRVPTVRLGHVRKIGPGRIAAVELDGPRNPLTRGIPFGEHAPTIGQYVRVYSWPAPDGRGVPELWIDALVGTEVVTTAEDALQTSVTQIGDDGAGDFVVRERLAEDALYRLVLGLDASNRARELWGNGTVSDVRRYRSGAEAMTFDDGSGGRIALDNGGSAILDAGTHGATGDPHSQYVPKTYYARTSVPGLPRILRAGTLKTKAISQPGIQEASVTVALGLTFAPFVLGMYAAENGRTVAVPDVSINQAGQVLDAVQLATEVVSTNKTKVTATVQTSRPKGRGAVLFHWLLVDRVGG